MARDRAAFTRILEDTRPEVKTFLKGQARRQTIEQEFRKLKRDFNLDQFGVVLP